MVLTLIETVLRYNRYWKCKFSNLLVFIPFNYIERYFRAKPGTDSEPDNKDKKKEKGRERKKRSASGSSSSDSRSR